MADPKVRFKRSSVPGKIPNETQVPLGEIALNTYDGKVFASKNVGIGTTVFVVNPWSVGTGTDVYDTYFTTGNVGIGTTNPPDKLTVSGKIQIQQDSGSNNRLVFRGQPASSYRWNIDNYGSSNEFRIFREDDATSANGSVAVSISTIGTVTATKFSGDGSLLTGIIASSGVVIQNQGSNVGTASTINFSTNLTASFSSGTATISLSNNPSISGILTADQVYTSNNGNGQNVRIGDDFWLGDVNVADTTRFSGAQDSTRAFVIFGSSDAVALGRTGTGPLYYGGNFNVAGVVTATTFVGNLTGTATTATNLADAANITTGTINSARLSGSYNINISGNASSATYASTAGIATNATEATYAITAGIATNATSATYASTAGIATYADYATSSGIATYASTAGIATALQNSRTFEITGDIIASPISFDGTGNVSLAATIQPNSVALGTDTTGDYVTNITGTSNQITVTSGTGEGSTPTLSIPNQFTAPQDVTVTRDLQVDRNLNVNGNITIGGTSATLFTSELKVFDADLVLGFRTDANGNDISTDNTANHGGIAVASTEGTPLISLYDVGIGETNPATYKKIMWFKSGTFSGLGTDAWISNYAIGIGSTQVPNGVRLAAGGMQVTDTTVSTPQLIVSGVTTSSSFVKSGGTSSQFLKADGSVDSSTYITGIGIRTEGSIVGTGITLIDFRGAGISTITTPVAGIATVNITGGGGSGGASVSISTVAPSSPSSGDLWYNSNLGRTFIYYNDGSSSQWVDAAPFNPAEPPSTPGKTSSTFVASSGQTTFTVSYKLGYIDVFLNGVRLNAAEYTENSSGGVGISISLSEPASLNDVIDVVEYTMGIGATGPTGAAGTNGIDGSGGPLNNITQTTSNSVFYPVLVPGIGNTIPYITTTTNYLEFTPSSGTLEVNQIVVVGVTTSSGGFSGNVTGEVNAAAFDTNPSGIIVTGIATATDFNSTSDVNLKENINIINDPLKKLVGISGVTFNWKQTKEKSAGVIAQDVEKVFSEIVKSNDETKTVNYNGLIGLLIEAVKSQQEQINSLTERIKSLEE